MVESSQAYVERRNEIARRLDLAAEGHLEMTGAEEDALLSEWKQCEERAAELKRQESLTRQLLIKKLGR